MCDSEGDQPNPVFVRSPQVLCLSQAQAHEVLWEAASRSLPGGLTVGRGRGGSWTRTIISTSEGRMSVKGVKGAVKQPRLEPAQGYMGPRGRGPGAEGPQGKWHWAGASSTGAGGAGGIWGPRVGGPGSAQGGACCPALAVPCGLRSVIPSEPHPPLDPLPLGTQEHPRRTPLSPALCWPGCAVWGQILSSLERLPAWEGGRMWTNRASQASVTRAVIRIRAEEPGGRRSSSLGGLAGARSWVSGCKRNAHCSFLVLEVLHSHCRKSGSYRKMLRS